MIIDIILPLSLLFIMFSLGLSLTMKDFVNVVYSPKVFLVGLINQMIILPLVTFIIISIFILEPKLSVGMMILACCPGGVTSNILTKLAKGDTALSISYTAIVSILTVISLPLIVGFSMEYFLGSNAPQISIFSLSITMFILTTVPVAAGLYLNKYYNKFSTSFSRISNKISTFLFILIVIGALASEWKVFINNIFVLGPSIVILIIIMFIQILLDHLTFMVRE